MPEFFPTSHPDEDSNTLLTIDDVKFVDLYDRQFVKLGASARAGLCELIQHDVEITDVRWCAYMLATVKHEWKERWKPIDEDGQGAGKDYGKPETITDKSGKKHTNTYYGRGYAQLTHSENYRRMGRKLGLGEDLLINPDNALVPEASYQVMSVNMRTGGFTGVKLSQFINGKRCDYRNARQIINRHDNDIIIADYAGNESVTEISY